LGQKIEAVEGIVPVWRSLVGRCAAIGLMQQRIADLPIFVLGFANYTRKNRRGLQPVVRALTERLVDPVQERWMRCPNGRRHLVVTDRSAYERAIAEPARSNRYNSEPGVRK
jgi:hypothetical protein